MVKSVASEQHSCLSVERPWDSNLYFAITLSHYSKQGFPDGTWVPQRTFFEHLDPLFIPKEIENWELQRWIYLRKFLLNFVTSGKNFSAWNWKLGVAEVNISPKIPTSAQPLKMALHKYGCWLHGCWIIFLHKSKKNSFFAWLKDFFLHHSKGNLLNLPFKTYGVVLQPCVARSIARLLCMH